MVRIVAYEQVLVAVVERIAVDVVDYLVRLQGTPEGLLRNDTMFDLPLAIDINPHYFTVTAVILASHTMNAPFRARATPLSYKPALARAILSLPLCTRTWSGV
jgi:hypothetical protein